MHWCRGDVRPEPYQMPQDWDVLENLPPNKKSRIESKAGLTMPDASSVMLETDDRGLPREMRLPVRQGDGAQRL